MLELVGIIVGIIAGASVVLFGSRGLVDFIRGASERRRRHTEVSSGDQPHTSSVGSQTGTAGTIEMKPARLAETQPISTGGVFIGRQRELGELKGALEDSLAGHGRVIMLAGEPGVGKTRTAQELASYARSSNAEVVWGRSYQEVGTPPLWPWIEVMRALVRSQDTEKLRAKMGPGVADIAEILPDLQAKLPDLQTRPELEPEQARFRLYDSMTTFLVNEARSRPLLLVLEDLHWADTSSLRMLEFLSGHIGDSPLLVVGAYRDVELSSEHPLTETVANLSHERNFRLETLRTFSEEQTGDLIEATGGLRPSPALIQRIQGHTEGNPLFVIEMVRLLAELGQLDSNGNSSGDEFAVPEGVRAVTRQRLRRLSTLCNEALSTASIVGREFDFGLLHRLLDDTTEEDLSGALEQALRGHLVEELAWQPGRFQFSHSLIQQAVAEELSATRRMRLHARIAEALEAYYGEHTAAHAAELAHHFAQAQTVLSTEKLVRYSLLAGEQALANYAWEEALAHFQRGLSARGVPLEGREPAPDDEAAALLFGLGQAQVATVELHQVRDAVASMSRAFEYYTEVGDVIRAVAVAGHPVHASPAVHTGMGQLIVHALRLVPPDSSQALRLLARQGQVLGNEEGDYEGAQEAFRQALAIAWREGSPALEMQTLVNAIDVDWFHLGWQAGLQKSLRIIELAGQLDDRYAELVACHRATVTLSHLGKLEEARPHASTMLALAERLRHRFWLTNALWRNENLSRLEGDWRAARDYSNRALAVSPLDSRPLYTRALLEYEVGDFGQGEAHLERFMAVMRQSTPGPNVPYLSAAMIPPMIARITGVADRLLDVATAAADTILSSPSVTPRVALCTRAGLAVVATQRGDAATARDCYVPLESQRSTILDGGILCIDRLLGLLSATMGNPDLAANHFEDALAFCRRAGYRPELAWTCCDYGDCLKARNNPVDRQRILSLLDEALAISSELGMRPLMERVLSRRESLGT